MTLVRSGHPLESSFDEAHPIQGEFPCFVNVCYTCHWPHTI